jgi:hypothetical protein
MVPFYDLALFPRAVTDVGKNVVRGFVIGQDLAEPPNGVVHL